LIEDILQYSRIGKIDVSLQPVECASLFLEVIDTLAPPPAIKVSLDGEFPTINYSELHLHQVAQNLIGNAIKYMGRSEGEVVVSCLERDDDWEFKISDNGTGIEKRHFERIFKIFQSLKPHLQKSPGESSTGIGLALVKKIIELHGGTVRLESVVGEGSSFFFTIPKRDQTGD